VSARPLLLALLACLACGKAAKPGASDLGPPDAVTGGTTSTAGTAGMPATETPSACTADAMPGPAPLTRLHARELQRSMADAVGGVPVEEIPSAGYDFASEVQEPAHQRWVENVRRVAHDAALAFSRDAAALEAVGGCTAEQLGAPACREQFLKSFLRRAFRRPASDEDLIDMNAVFEEGERLGGDAVSGARAVVEVALQSPELLYLFALGQPSSQAGLVELTSHEVAARLSYFLTGAPPDLELRSASDAAKLDANAVRAHARRLLGGPLSREQVRWFYQQLYRLDISDLVTTDAEFGSVLLPLAQAETSRFIEHVTFEGPGTFRALLLDTSSWLSEPLARFYGVAGVTGTEPSPVQLDPSRRAGLFTRATFLASASHPDVTSPVARAVRVLSRLLCYQLPPPPETVSLEPEEPLPFPYTMRQRLSAATAPVACRECHRDIDPIGFAFEHYDYVGRWRDQENGLPIDSSGQLYRTDAQGRFQNAVELMTLIAESDDAKACFVDHWSKLAYRRKLDPADGCARERLSAAFAASDGNVVDLLVELAASDNFRYRAKIELEP
jgi:hypothetical protein